MPARSVRAQTVLRHGRTTAEAAISDIPAWVTAAAQVAVHGVCRLPTRGQPLCSHPIGREIATPTTGFKVQPPHADRRSKVLIVQSTLSCGAGRHPTQGVRPQFDQANWNCRPSAVLRCSESIAGKQSVEVIEPASMHLKLPSCSVRPEVSKGSAVLHRCPSIPQGERRFSESSSSIVPAQ